MGTEAQGAVAGLNGLDIAGWLVLFLLLVALIDRSAMGRLAMTPRPDLEYDPIASILDGSKRQTLRTRRMAVGRMYRVWLPGGEATRIIVRVTEVQQLSQKRFNTNTFARADGLPNAAALRKLLCSFYHGIIPATMYCCHFEVVTTDG